MARVSRQDETRDGAAGVAGHIEVVATPADRMRVLVDEIRFIRVKDTWGCKEADMLVLSGVFGFHFRRRSQHVHEFTLPRIWGSGLPVPAYFPHISNSISVNFGLVKCMVPRCVLIS